jgi:P27 family predicted phage terminase small subunit
MKGRRPKPYAQKVAEGRAPKNLIPRIETSAVIHNPPFELPPWALQRFNELKSIATWLRDLDAFALADYCLTEWRILQCEQDIERRGLQVRTRRGPVSNPYSRHLRHYRAHMNRLASELGFTPASRERISDTDEASRPGAVDRLELVMSGELVWDESIRDYVPATAPRRLGKTQ